MDLNALARGFIAEKQEQLSRELAEKYRVPEDEVADVVECFLKETYRPAERMAQAISGKSMVLLFIGRKDCSICERCWPVLESFLLNHKDVELVKKDYSEPEGLLYHMIQRSEKGKLPMIAFICGGDVRVVFTGECLNKAVFEIYYSDMKDECSQNIYVH